MVSLLKGLMRRLVRRCPECGSNSLDIKLELIESHVEYENFPSGCFYADWEVKTEKKTRYCPSCGYERYLGESTSRIQIA